jgi:hypothetical protein
MRPHPRGSGAACRIILRLADGASYLDIERSLGESSRTIGKWKRRFLTDRVDGLPGRYPGSVATVLTPALEARILAPTRRPVGRWLPRPGSRRLARALKLSSHTLVAHAWQRAGLNAQRVLADFTRQRSTNCGISCARTRLQSTPLSQRRPEVGVR